MLRVELGNPSRKFLKKCDGDIYERLIKKIRSLSENPFPQDVVRVVGRKEKVFRVRVGYYRIQYIVYYEKSFILITDIDKRPRAYD